MDTADIVLDLMTDQTVEVGIAKSGGMDKSLIDAIERVTARGTAISLIQVENGQGLVYRVSVSPKSDAHK